MSQPRCGICFDNITRPATLKCGHVYCMHCLTAALAVPNQPRRCPACREGTKDAPIALYFDVDHQSSLSSSPHTDDSPNPSLRSFLHEANTALEAQNFTLLQQVDALNDEVNSLQHQIVSERDLRKKIEESARSWRHEKLVLQKTLKTEVARAKNELDRSNQLSLQVVELNRVLDEASSSASRCEQKRRDAEDELDEVRRTLSISTARYHEILGQNSALIAAANSQNEIIKVKRIRSPRQRSRYDNSDDMWPTSEVGRARQARVRGNDSAHSWPSQRAEKNEVEFSVADSSAVSPSIRSSPPRFTHDVEFLSSPSPNTPPRRRNAPGISPESSPILNSALFTGRENVAPPPVKRAKLKLPPKHSGIRLNNGKPSGNVTTGPVFRRRLSANRLH